MSPLRRPVVAVGRAVVAVLVAACSAALPAAASAAPTVAKVAPARVAAGTPVTVTGSVAPVVAGQHVRVELHVGSAWTQVGPIATTDARGAWSTSFAAARGGELRAVQVEDGSTSPTSALAVVPVVSGVRLSSRSVLPFAGVTATWTIATRGYPSGTRVRADLSIGGKAAGFVRGRVKHGVVRLHIPTNGVGTFRAKLVLPMAPGFAATNDSRLRFGVRAARVGSGSSAAWVRALRSGLRFRGVFVPRTGSFDSRMGDSVIAFHKAYGRSRTTTFEARDWTLLTRSRVVARDTSRGLHIEVDKGRQILMQVRDGRPISIIHISSGRTGNTPAGHHKVLWKGLMVPSFYETLLYRSMAFQGGFAIHGYPSVPTSPASHGCVRVPMWIANSLYQSTPVGTPVYVYAGPGSTGTSFGKGGTTPDVAELSGVDVERWADERA